jgi:branched-chain amino acid transport system ATP-binding protein
MPGSRAGRLKREDDLALLAVEQHARLAFEPAPKVIILDRGLIVFARPSREPLDDPPQLNVLREVGPSSFGHEGAFPEPRVI